MALPFFATLPAAFLVAGIIGFGLKMLIIRFLVGDPLSNKCCSPLDWRSGWNAPLRALNIHADEYETAAVVRYFPDSVDYEALRDLPPTDLTIDDLKSWRQGGEAARRLTPRAYFGAPNPVDPDLWRYFDEIARIMAEAVAPH